MKLKLILATTIFYAAAFSGCSKDDDKDEKHKKVIEKNLDLLEQDKNISIVPPESVRNGLFAPK